MKLDSFKHLYKQMSSFLSFLNCITFPYGALNKSHALTSEGWRFLIKSGNIVKVVFNLMGLLSVEKHDGVMQ